MKKIFTLPLLFFVLSLIFTSCQKETPKNEPTPPTNETDTTEFVGKLIESQFMEVYYWGDYYNSQTDNYTLYLGNAEHEGVFIKSEGDFIVLSIMTSLSPDPSEATIPTGTFSFDPKNTFDPMTIVGGTDSGYYQYFPSTDGSEYMTEEIHYFTSGELTISKSDNNTYTFTATLTMDNEEELKITYGGEIIFTNTIEGLTPSQITSDKEFESTFGEIFYMDNGLYKIDLMSGDNPYESASWSNRDRLNLFIHSEDNPERVAEGTYPVLKTPTDATNYVEAGNYSIVSGSMNWNGSAYFYMDGYTWEATYGFIDNGNVTISYNEDNEIIIEVDVTDLNGFSIKSNYIGPATITEQV